jgi:DNA primase
MTDNEVKNIDVDRLKQSVSIVDVISACPDIQVRPNGREFIGICPFHDDGKPSLTIVPKREFYKCFACGAKGDVIEFVTNYYKISFVEALKRLSEDAGLSYLETRKPAPRKQYVPVEKNISREKDLYKNAMPSDGTIVETYWQSRGIDTKKLNPHIFTQIRFTMMDYWHPISAGDTVKLGRYPAQLAPIQSSAGVFQGLHITYLAHDGLDKACIEYDGKKLNPKKMRGNAWGGAIRLGPAQSIMGVTEGIENGLSVLSACDHISIWVAGSLGNFAGAGIGQGDMHPVDQGKRLPSVIPDHAKPGFIFPDKAKKIYAFTDNDSKDSYSANAQFERAFRKFKHNGLEVIPVWPPTGKDINDLINGKEGKPHD